MKILSHLAQINARVKKEAEVGTGEGRVHSHGVITAWFGQVEQERIGTGDPGKEIFLRALEGIHGRFTMSGGCRGGRSICGKSTTRRLSSCSVMPCRKEVGGGCGIDIKVRI